MSIGPNTKTTLSTLCIVCGAALASWGYLDKKFNQQENQTATTLAAMSEVRKEVADLKAGQYTVSAAAEQALRMAIENPGLRVPDPRNPGQIIVVDKSRTIGGAN